MEKWCILKKHSTFDPSPNKQALPDNHILCIIHIWCVAMHTKNIVLQLLQALNSLCDIVPIGYIIIECGHQS